jgi:hypothetical protein
LVKGKTDACKLLTADEIRSIVGETLKDASPSENSSGPFATTQCLYATTNFVNSVSLTVTEKNPADAGGEGIREFWRERFGRSEREERREKERDKDRRRGEEEEGEEEESLPPQPVKSLGDEAYAVGNEKIGALYVLKGDKLLRISIGGAHSREVRTQKMKALAQSALKRL